MEIMILGAGIGGLTLANILRDRLPTARVRVYERDATFSSRGQGYGIGLRADGGLKVLSELGLEAEAARNGKAAQRFRILTARGRELMSLEPLPSSPEFTLSLSRHWLRRTLLERIGTSAVTWNARALRFENDGDRGRVHFENGSTSEADVVVACDGANSVIRSQLVRDEPRYLGIGMIGGFVDSPPSHPLLDDGAYMSLGVGRSFFVQDYGDGQTIWSYGFRCAERSLDEASPTDLLERARKEAGDFHAPASELIARTDPARVVFRGYYDRDPVASARAGRVVLLGDAAHPMTPFRGQGANMAMLDAASLARTLADSADIDASLSAFEREMLTRTRPHVLTSRKAAVDYHAGSAFVCARRNVTLWLLGRLLAMAVAGERHRQQRLERRNR